MKKTEQKTVKTPVTTTGQVKEKETIIQVKRDMLEGVNTTIPNMSEYVCDATYTQIVADSKIADKQSKPQLKIALFGSITQDIRLNSRKKYGSIPDLAEDIKKRGLQTPIQVCKFQNEETNIWSYLPLDGNRRTQAVKYANDTLDAKITHVPIVLVPDNDIFKAGTKTRFISDIDPIKLNLFHYESDMNNEKSLPLNPVDKATIFYNLIEAGMTREQISERYNGISVSHISAQLHLYYADSQIQKLIEEGILSGTSAINVIKSVGQDAAKKAILTAKEMKLKKLKEAKEKQVKLEASKKEKEKNLLTKAQKIQAEKENAKKNGLTVLSPQIVKDIETIKEDSRELNQISEDLMDIEIDVLEQEKVVNKVTEKDIREVLKPKEQIVIVEKDVPLVVEKVKFNSDEKVIILGKFVENDKDLNLPRNDKMRKILENVCIYLQESDWTTETLKEVLINISKG